jgi:hypothetical protein
MNTRLIHAIAAFAAVLTTVAIFSAVDSLADPGPARSQLMAATVLAARG